MSDKTLKYKGYCGSVEVSIEDNCLHGKILFIDDLLTYESDSAVGLETEFKAAIDYYLEKCAREGLSADKPFSGSFNVRIAPDLHKTAAMKAASRGTTLNDLVRDCIAMYLAR